MDSRHDSDAQPRTILGRYTEDEALAVAVAVNVFLEISFVRWPELQFDGKINWETVRRLIEKTICANRKVSFLEACSALFLNSMLCALS